MAVKIKFDSTHNAIEPTMVLAKKTENYLVQYKQVKLDLRIY